MGRVRAVGIILDAENNDGAGFRVWDVTKNVTSQHNQTALTKFGCARQYANHCSTCSDIPLKVRERTMARMSARILHIGDAVKITHGDSRGLFGIIVEIRENEAEVFLTLHDVTTSLPFSSLRKHLKVGDEVRILSGDNQGVTGWVVNQDDDNLCVFNDRTGSEVNVLV